MVSTKPGHITTPNYCQSDDKMEILAPDTSWPNKVEEELSQNERYNTPSAKGRQKEQRQKRPKREHVTSNESQTPPSWKRQHSETASLETKIAKTRDYKTAKETHWEPKSLKYAAWANISPDVEFKDELKAIKQTTKQAYVRALTKFHYRRLNKQETKLNKSRQSPAPTNRQGFYKT